MHQTSPLRAQLSGRGPFELEFEFDPSNFYRGLVLSFGGLVAVTFLAWSGIPKRDRHGLTNWRLPRPIVLGTAATLCALGAGLWWQQCRPWARADALYQEGKMFLEAGDDALAAQHFSRAIGVQPRHLLARKRLARCRFWQGELQEAAGLFEESERVLVLESDDVIMYTIALCETGQAEAARVLSNRWYKAARSSPYVYATSAVLCAYIGDNDDRVPTELRADAYYGLPSLDALRASPRLRKLLDTAEGKQIQKLIDRIWDGADEQRSMQR